MAHAQVFPVESLLKPEQRGPGSGFQVRLFNAKGQFLRMAKADEVEFSVQGPGKISKRVLPGGGKGWEYATPKSLAHTSVGVTAKFGKLVGSARIRLVPDYNWKFDFSDGQVPSAGLDAGTATFRSIMTCSRRLRRRTRSPDSSTFT
ncbi:MAG: hypothetical protein CM1200mP2_25040 [Planctomycetaceae bacterium]|nr:MAG: hypothetical protein CM1200mP2_25040 [Planctomycetaceae bacterium]